MGSLGAPEAWPTSPWLRVEAGDFAYQQAKIELHLARREVAKFDISSFLEDGLYGGDTEELEKAKAVEKKAERSLDNVSASIGAAFIEDARSDNAIGKLSRYEASLERSLKQACVELERLQAVRQAKNGANTSPPVTIDMTARNDVDPP